MTADDELDRARARRAARVAGAVPPTDDYQTARARLAETVERRRAEVVRRGMGRGSLTTAYGPPRPDRARPVVDVPTGDRL